MSIDIARAADEEETRLIGRVNEYALNNIAWYQSKKRIQRWLYYGSGVVSVLGASLIPVFNVLLDNNARFATAVCGGVVVVSTSLSAFFRWQLNWINYSTAQDHVESTYRKWLCQVDRLHDCTQESERLQRLRRLCERAIADIELIRRSEASITLSPLSGPSQDEPKTGPDN
jgi:hypothetical protein